MPRTLLTVGLDKPNMSASTLATLLPGGPGGRDLRFGELGAGTCRAAGRNGVRRMVRRTRAVPSSAWTSTRSSTRTFRCRRAARSSVCGTNTACPRWRETGRQSRPRMAARWWVVDAHAGPPGGWRAAQRLADVPIGSGADRQHPPPGVAARGWGLVRLWELPAPVRRCLEEASRLGPLSRRHRASSSTWGSPSKTFWTPGSRPGGAACRANPLNASARRAPRMITC